ncbi:MAG: hypothetical protein ABIN37_10450, partial [Burkholderiaceae bacterium]
MASTSASNPAARPGAERLLQTFMGRLGRRFVIGVPMAFLLLIFAMPFLVVLKISLSEMDGVRFLDLFTWSNGLLQINAKFGNYQTLWTDDLYL